MAGNKCKHCGSSEIEEDPARGDAVCMNCGAVLESNLIVSEVQFQEAANGTSSAIGQFVSAESKGGICGNFGNSFHRGMGTESREITLRKARQGITTLCNQLNLNQHYIDTACNFFKMALSRQLTRGRKNTHVFAACVYITCRTSGTSHLLIDISDALQICCYELGRTYLRLSKALCINIPSVDPCIYILRFANKLQLEDKTQQVTTTALRLVQRMKRDSIHSGRRPSGLCGAALLMAARLHNFSRNTGDIVKIVKVHESTLRKRLFEFGDTPSSALTLEEFMTVDLEEEQDPPAFKAARKKDKERLMKLHEEGYEQITEMQKEIDSMLQESSTKRRFKKYEELEAKESQDVETFITESTIGIIKNCISDNSATSTDDNNSTEQEIGPNLVTFGLVPSNSDERNNTESIIGEEEGIEIKLDGLDEDEIDSYIMSADEAKYKDGIWNKINATYLEEQKIKQEKLAKEKEEGKTEKRKKKSGQRKKQTGPANSAGEAIEKMLQEKRLSSKINYDALKSLNIKSESKPSTETTQTQDNDNFAIPKPPPEKRQAPPTPEIKKLTASKRKTIESNDTNNMDNSITSEEITTPTKKHKVETETENENIDSNPPATPTPSTLEDEDLDEYYDEEQPSTSTEMGMFQMLKNYRGDEGDGDDFDNYGGFEEGYDEEY